jgi:tetratricopeptide (TPR) repeat protein
MAVLLAQSILLVILAAGPWLFGGVREEAWFAVAVLASLACLSLSRLRRDASRLAIPTALLPLLLGLALGAVQLIPLDSQTLGLLSPMGSELREDFQRPGSSADASLAEEHGAAAPDSQPLTLYPASTRHDLSVLTLAVSAFFLGATLFHAPRTQLWLCFVLAINGAAVAAFGIVQKLTSSHSVYWVVPVAPTAHPFGPYVNQNNAAGYLTLCLAAALGMLIWLIGRSREIPLPVGRFPSPRKPTLTARLKRSVLEFFARLDAGQIAAFSVAACVVMGIVCALSRGAWIATAGAMIVTGAVVLGTRRGTGAIAILSFVAAAGIALALWAGISGSAGRRLADLFNAAQSPWPHWQESSRAVPDFWRLGSGLGTYRHVYGLYEDRPRDSWYYHAENQYLETLVEAGVPGLVLLVAMVAIVAWSVWYGLCRESDPGAIAFGIVALFAVAAQVLHAFFDFGLYIPANMLTFAVLCGAVTGRAAQLAAQSRSSGWLALPRLGWVPLAVTVALGAATGWGFFELRGASAVEQALRNAHFDEETPSGASAAELDSAIAQLSTALAGREDDAEGHSQLGVLWTHLYHARAFQLLEQRRSGETDTDEATLWSQASLSYLHRRACLFARAKQSVAFEALRRQPAVVQNLQPALKHFLLARRYCPLIAESHVGLGTLLPLEGDLGGDQVALRRSWWQWPWRLEGDLAGDRIALERARRLQPTNPEILFQCGLLDFEAGRLDAAYASWKTCLSLSDKLSDKFLRPVLWLTSSSLEDVETARKLLPDAPGLLIRLTRKELASARYEEARAAITQRALELLDEGDLPKDETCYLRALALENRKEYAEAIKNFDRAVQLRPRDTAWREEYANLLEGQGMISDAIEQVVVLARMYPGNSRIWTWLMRLRLTLHQQTNGE